jgi:hypothetical protein
VFVAMAVVLGACLGLILVASQCGAPGPATDKADPQKVVVAFLTALARGDLDAARGLATTDCWAQFEREMRDFQAEVPGMRNNTAFRERAERQLGPDWAAQVDRLDGASVSEVWAFLLKLVPMLDPPELAGIGLDPNSPGKRQWFYWSSNRDRRAVDLRLRHGVWMVDKVGLL